VAIFGAWRFIPIAAMYPFGEPSRGYFPGYESVPALLDAFINTDAQAYRQQWWEYDGYIGVAALVFIVAFGLVGPFTTQYWKRHLRVLVPVVVFMVWAMAPPLVPGGGIFDFQWWNGLGLPVLATERMPSRFLVVPFAMLAAAACITLQQAIERTRLWIVPASVVLALTVLGIHWHRAVWCDGIAAGDLAPPEASAYLLADPPAQQEYQTSLPNAAPPRHIVYDTHRYRSSIMVGGFVTASGVAGALWYLVARR